MKTKKLTPYEASMAVVRQALCVVTAWLSGATPSYFDSEVRQLESTIRAWKRAEGER
jgi:hypothetical protein